jgi:photosystem II stability/assembly factor-like uncharacterized protein
MQVHEGQTMTVLKVRYLAPIALVVLTAGAFVATRSHSEASTTVEALARETHFHGIAVDSSDPSRLYLATHHGLYAVAADGSATRRSPVQDFMGFTPHPTDSSTLYASGHPAGGGNLGFIASEDGGRSWSQLAEGVGGPVDFHQMDVSPADPKTIYGAYTGQLQASRDGGRGWEVVGPAPEGLIDLAASSKGPAMLYAATQSGLLKSDDGGRTWQDAYWLRQPATMVHVTPDGVVYAFLVGTGLIWTTEPKLTWQTVDGSFGEEYVLHFAVGPTTEGQLFAVTMHPQTHRQGILASRDGGKTWLPLNEAGG